ncbi:MAG: hypothetical protein K9J81_02175 [Desulfohalobiaceae bacterium]|nr:hypothetical protein [Desulfohalobiaceae bacterium]
MQQSERVGRDLRRLKCKGKMVSLKVTFDDFKVITRSRSLEKPTDTTKISFQTASSLLSEVNLQKPVGLTGVSVSKFEKGPVSWNCFRMLRSENRRSWTGSWIESGTGSGRKD